MEIKNKIQLTEILNIYDNIIIYGAKVGGAALIHFIQELPLPLLAELGVAVSDTQDNLLECQGYIVKNIDSYIKLKEKGVVLVATQSKFRDEIISTAKSFGFLNIYKLSDELLEILIFDEVKSRVKEMTTQECFDMLYEAQNEVLATSVHTHYENCYSKCDLGFFYMLAQHIYDLAGEKNNVKNCLDIGCAYGTFAVYMSKLFEANIYCIDCTQVFLSAELIKNRNLIFELSRIELDPFPWDMKYDIIVLTEVMEHFSFHLLPTLIKISNLLSEDGILLLSVPNVFYWGETQIYDSLEDIPMPTEYKGETLIDEHKHHYSESELLNLFDKGGLEILKKDIYKQHQFVLKRKVSLKG